MVKLEMGPLQQAHVLELGSTGEIQKVVRYSVGRFRFVGGAEPGDRNGGWLRDWTELQGIR